MQDRDYFLLRCSSLVQLPCCTQVTESGFCVDQDAPPVPCCGCRCRGILHTSSTLARMLLLLETHKLMDQNRLTPEVDS